MSTEFTLYKKDGVEIFLEETSSLFSINIYDANSPWTTLPSIEKLTLEDLKDLVKKLSEISSYYV